MDHSGESIILSEIKVIIFQIVLCFQRPLEVYFLFHERIWRLREVIFVAKLILSKVYPLDFFLNLIIVQDVFREKSFKGAKKLPVLQ